MDPIIRHASVSPFARRIGRVIAPMPLAVPGAVAQVPAVSPTRSAAAPARGTGGGVYLASSVSSATAATVGGGTVVERDYDAELANVARQHAAQLNERDKEISSLRLASAQAASALAQARADAEQRGFAAGVAKGEHAGRATLTAQAEQLAEVARQVNAAHGAAIDSAEITMVEIAFAAVCRIVGDEGFGRERVRSIVRKAVAESRAREQVTVRLHPDDAALLVEGSEQPEMGPHIVADPLVRLGGCIVDSPSGTLDARFETQLTLLATALKEAREPNPQVKGVP